jgi:hypothetical protein
MPRRGDPQALVGVEADRPGRTGHLAVVEEVRAGPHPLVVYAAQATEVALDSIARSNGSRRSVARALFDTDLRTSLIGPVAFDPRGDLKNAPVAIVVARRGGGSDEVLSSEGASLVAVRGGAPPVP